MQTPWRGFAVAWLVILLGSVAAQWTHTAGGDITIKDIRFSGNADNTLSALLYLPPNATPLTPAPGILAVHGYINSRETQAGFAIEFARRGYVVLALDQTGHGYSDPPAFGAGFGGPAALAYLRSLAEVDAENIGLEGHSMGGWAVLAAATAWPDAYKAIVLEGSSTGAPFAEVGTPTWPRNVSVVFSQFDEFASLMWGVGKAQEVAQSAKLQALFGTETPVVADQLYGDISQGTARILQQPAVTHPGDHISQDAIGHSIDWFARTLDGGTPIPSSEQIWFGKELGTLVALIGFVMLIVSSFRLLLQYSFFRQLKVTPGPAAFTQRSGAWWALAALLTTLPVATFYLIFGWAEQLLPPSAWLPQGITTQVAFWALANGVLASIIGLFSRRELAKVRRRTLPAIAIALAVIMVAYASVFLADYLFLIDFRFWFVGVKQMNAAQFGIALVYLLPFTAYFMLATRGLHLGMSVQTDSPFKAYCVNACILMGGFLMFLLAQYAALFTTGSLLTPTEPLNTIVMIQFVPLLLIVSIISTATYRSTGDYLPGALINGAFVTWYVVAGQATQYAA